MGAAGQYPERLPRAVLLAVESLRRYPERAANQLVADGLVLLPREAARMMHEGEVTAVAFSPDGRWVVSGSRDGTVRVWWWRPEDLIRLACERLTRNLTREEWRQYLGDEPYRATCPNLPEEPQE